MAREEQTVGDAAPLTPAVFHILLALADGEKHGYAIMREIAERTDGAMRMGPGTLYGSIQRMLKDGLIAETQAPARAGRSGNTGELGDTGDERRRYYRLTDHGRLVMQAEARRLEQLVRLAQSKQVIPGFNSFGGA